MNKGEKFKPNEIVRSTLKEDKDFPFYKVIFWDGDSSKYICSRQNHKDGRMYFRSMSALRHTEKDDRDDV